MSDFPIRFAQLLLAVWPALLLIVTVSMLPGRGRFMVVLQRALKGLTITWWILACLWFISLFDHQTIPGLINEPYNSLYFMGGLAVTTALYLRPVLQKTLRNRKRVQQVHRIAQLLALSPTEFEELVGATYKRLGFGVKHTGKSGDHGIDVRLRTPAGESWIVQCKRYRGSVGEGTIRELYGTLIHEGARRAVLVTSGEITEQARQWAQGKPIELIDGDGFLRMIDQARRQGGNSLWRKITKLFRSALRPTPKTLRICPQCGAPLINKPMAANGKSNHTLLRCYNYPACRVTLEAKSLKPTPFNIPQF